MEDLLIFVYKTSGMVCGFALVFFFSMMELCVLGQSLNSPAECGKTANITIPCNNMKCNLSIPITNVTLKKDNVQLWTTDKPSCSQDTKYCFEIADGNQTLIVRSPSFEEQGVYTLNIARPGYFESFRIYFYVNGVCEPELSTSKDGLTNSVMTNYQDKPGAKSFQEVSGNDKRNSIIPVVCVLVVIGFGVACYIAYRFRRHLKGGFSNSNLLGFEENTESSAPLQSSQDPV